MVGALHFVIENGAVSPAFLDAVAEIPGLELQRVTGWESLGRDEMLGMMRGCEVLLASRAPAVPDELAEDPGSLKYICYLHGTMRKVIGLPVIRSGIQVTNWGDQAGYGLAEGSLALLMAVIKDLPKRILAVRAGGGRGIRSTGGTLAGLDVGVYGFGFAGREFARLMEPFGSTVRVYDPYAEDVPPPCLRVDSLRELFAASKAVVIHAGLTPETEKSVTAELLALLPDGGVVINTARGAIIDQPALFDELRSGRLRAGVDVLWPDDLPAGHEARGWENLIWTCHEFGGKPWKGGERDAALRHYRVFLDNIRAFIAGRPLEFTIDETRYSRMT
ncbi:MAG: NAD(P)-dependent oxidoreductase [Planctomycetota bacterium]|jgi:D-3-phosphoglycerate dehydrogenase